MFEDSQTNLDTRFRGHLKSSASDSDFSELSSHSRGTAAYLPSRGMRAEEHFSESSKPPPFAAPSFLKDATESSYLSITPKVVLRRRRQGNPGLKSSSGSWLSWWGPQLGWLRYED